MVLEVKIRSRRKCPLCFSQKPITDAETKADVFWAGISAKISEAPLSSGTDSDRPIQKTEDACSGIRTYRANIVKCSPLEKSGKFSYLTDTNIKIKEKEIKKAR